MLRRHDLVHLDQGSGHKIEVLTEHRPLLEKWLALNRPFVVGRQIDGDGLLHLGFTVPLSVPFTASAKTLSTVPRSLNVTAPKQRVAVTTTFDHVTNQYGPPELSTLINTAPQSWQSVITNLSNDFKTIGLTVQCYGSLVNQFYTQENCLHPESDLDVLIDCTHRASVEQALSVLETYQLSCPKIDGEIRMHQHWAVSWRELANARRTGAKILVKSNTTVQLMSVNDFLNTPACHES
jgi:malonate decarboxylase holo-[acyl-carrier-protein] synthase